MDRNTELSAIAQDLELCELGLATTTGALKRRYARHRKACLARIEEIAPVDPEIAELSDDELLAELMGE